MKVNYLGGKIMNRDVFFVGILGMIFGMLLAGCDKLTDSGCPGNGKCRIMTNSDADGAYEYCCDSGCAISKVPYPVPPNTM
jgi:hypothetical protein